MATTWEDAQDKWLFRLATMYKRSSQICSTTLVQHLLEMQWIMWENKNYILHNKDHIWQKNKRNLWGEEISDRFDSDMEETFLQGDIKILMGKGKVLKMDDSPKQQWLRSIKRAIIRKRVKEIITHIDQVSNALRNWL